ncbi:MAG: T9SS type A sorting domain-containing protein [Ignavibacteriales bacterium]|nr:T9SS type A sorting domain-containing protein [Ignavibacteriales bacterium]
MKIGIKVLFFLFFLTRVLFCAPIDTGMKTWVQPNGYTFTARMHGDEFSARFTMETNYEVYQGVDGWYYYGVLNNDGIVVSSEIKIGIGMPPPESYNIVLPQGRMTEIDNQRQIFAQQLALAKEQYANKRIEAGSNPVVMKIGVILVDFADSAHYRQGAAYPYGYKKEKFSKMLFSNDGDWFDTLLTIPPKHPEANKVYGSLRDYYNQQSLNKLDIKGLNGVTAEILNPVDPLHTGIPDWVYLSETKDYWANMPIGYDGAFRSEVLSAFQNKFGSTDFSQYSRLLFIYAGDFNANGYLHSHADPLFQYVTSERYFNVFSHIGVHAHEFGHLLGADDEYGGESVSTYFDLMDKGCNNGYHPNTAFNNGSCPAGHNPNNRIQFGWVTPVTLNDTYYTDLAINYNYQNPVYYKLDIPEDGQKFYIIENRLRAGFDQFTPNDPNYIPTDPNDPNGNQGGLLIWAIDETNNEHDKAQLKEAASTVGYNNGASTPFPYNSPDLISGLNLTQATLPNNSIAGLTNPGIEFLNIRWDSATKNVLLNIHHDYSQGSTIYTQNTTLSGSLVYDKGVVVLSGVTLTIDPNTTISLPFGKKFVLFDGANLVVNGGVNAPVIFRNSGSSWGGIQLIGANSQITGSNYRIEHAAFAFDIPYGRNITFTGGTFLYCSNLFNLGGYCTNSSTINIDNCRIYNTPSHSLIALFPASINISNCDLQGSNATFEGRVNCSLVNNNLREGSNLNLRSGATINQIKNNIFLNSSVTGISSNANITYNCIYPAPSPGNNIFNNIGNFSADPRFQYNGSNFYLAPKSPCIDAGDPSMACGNEPAPNGGRINMGTDGNTALATTTSIDLEANGNGLVLYGDFLTKRKWSLNSNLIIPFGTTAEFQPGSGFRFTNQNNLLVEGSLHALGFNDNPIVFDFYSEAEGQNSGIKLENNESNSSFQYCEVKNAFRGFEIRASSPVLEYLNIHDCFDGMYMENCYYFPDSREGIKLINSTVNNNWYGLNLSTASPLLIGNTITNNSRGVNCMAESIPYFGDVDGVEGLNTVTDNRISIYSNASSPLLGMVDGMQFGGLNIIGATDYYIFSENSSKVIFAQNNYWSAPKPDDMKFYPDPQYFDCNYYLTSPPFGKSQIPNNKKSAKIVTDNDKVLHPQIKNALKYLTSGKYNEAFQICKSLIDNNHDSAFAFDAVRIIQKVSYAARLKDSVTNYLMSLGLTGFQSEINIYAKILLADILKADYAQRLDSILVSYPNSVFAPYVYFKKFNYYLFEKNNEELAREISSEMALFYPANSLTKETWHLLGDTTEAKRIVKTQPKEMSGEIASFPNPFNPSTSLRYNVNVRGAVSLIIYNVLGEQVKQLVNEVKEPGIYEVSFNASQLPTGMYICHFTTSNSKKVLKLLLIK